MRKTIRQFEKMLEPAGIQLNGSNAWDIEVHDNAFFPRLVRDGTLGLGEAYMDGWWDCPALDEMIDRAFRAGLEDKVRNNSRFLLYLLGCRLLNRQSHTRAFQVGEQHYDIGNDVFEHMLDPYMNYSCGYWDKAECLAQAQVNKMQMICEKLGLEPGMQVLDVGCGWGGLARWMAEHHGVSVTGITVSKEQAQLAGERCAGLPVTIRIKDYRDLQGQFDRIVSVGMFEHVGINFFSEFFSKTYNLLKENGIFLLHTIGHQGKISATNPWMRKYIFPGGYTPSISELAVPIEKSGLIISDLEVLRKHYSLTLRNWKERCISNKSKILEMFDEKFFRMWEFYLTSCELAFKWGDQVVFQFQLAKDQTTVPITRDYIY